MRLKPDPLDLSSFSAFTLLIGSFDPVKPVPDMTYNVYGGMLNLALSIYLMCQWAQIRQEKGAASTHKVVAYPKSIILTRTCSAISHW